MYEYSSALWKPYGKNYPSGKSLLHPFFFSRCVTKSGRLVTITTNVRGVFFFFFLLFSRVSRGKNWRKYPKKRKMHPRKNKQKQKRPTSTSTVVVMEKIPAKFRMPTLKNYIDRVQKVEETRLRLSLEPALKRTSLLFSVFSQNRIARFIRTFTGGHRSSQDSRWTQKTMDTPIFTHPF